MLQIFVITLREGIETFLIVAITAGILRQTGRAAKLCWAAQRNSPFGITRRFIFYH